MEKMIESCLRYFDFMWKRSVEAPVKRVNQMEDNPIARVEVEGDHMLMV